MKQFTSHILIVVLFCSTLCCCNYTDLVAEEESTVKSETKLVEIVGGENARIDQFPHHAALIYQGEFTCSGSIIAKKFIVTAAHCVESGIEGLYVNVGTTNRGVTANQRLNVEKIKVHENYRDHPKYVENDIALIMLKTNLKYNTFVKPIELETQEVPIGSNVTIVGYGSQFTFGPVSEFLMFDNEIRVKSNHGCEGYKADNMSSIICLDSKPYGSTCNVRLSLQNFTFSFFYLN